MLFHFASDVDIEGPVVAIGNFDGVHRGHQAVIARACALAEELGTEVVVLTFEPHPVVFFRPDTPDLRLTSLEQKAALLVEHGVRAVLALEFDAALAGLSPRDFVESVLVRDLGACAVLVGADFHFGKGRAGDVGTLRDLGEEHGFAVVGLSLEKSGDEPISSTRVRAALREGDLDKVTRLLGRPHAASGIVGHGDALGRELGFPTANVDATHVLLPPDGIYAGRLHDGQDAWTAAVYIGTRPAVGGTARVLEAFCLDAPDDLDLYGQQVTVTFVAHVRDDANFASHADLVAQMERDVAAVRERMGRAW